MTAELVGREYGEITMLKSTARDDLPIVLVSATGRP